MGRHQPLGKRQKKWVDDAIDEVGCNPIKVYAELLNKHPRLCPSRQQTIRYVNTISGKYAKLRIKSKSSKSLESAIS